MTTQPDPLESAKENFAQGKYQECLRLLTFAFNQNPDNRDSYVLAGMCLKQMGADDEAKMFEHVVSQFDSSKAFFDLGYHFIDAGHDRLAVPMLERAFKLEPGNSNIGLELAIALCALFQPAQAREVLLQCDLSSSFWVGYQFYWSSLLCGITDGAEQFSKESRRQFLSQAASHEIRGALYALDKLDELRIRLAVMQKPPLEIQYWHFIQYGAAILDYFNEDEEQLNVAGGRWVYVGVSYQQLATTLNKLHRLLNELGKSPRQIIGLPDQDSAIIATAAGKIFDLPVQIVSKANEASQDDSLLIAANNWNLVEVPLERVLKGQTVFAFNHNWLNQGPNTPDVSGLMTQYCTWPWSKDRLLIDPETNQRMEVEEDTRSIEEIANEFAYPVADLGDKFADLLSFYKDNSVYLKGGRLGGNKRWRFIPDSPVPGSYFC